MKKNVPVLGIVAIIILAAAVFFIFFPKGLSDKDILANPQSGMEFCQKAPLDKQTGCYFRLADVLATNNSDVALQACLAMSAENDRKGCTENLASRQENQTRATEICNSMKNDTNFREHCYGAIIAGSGNLNTDTQLLMCDSKTGMDKDNCYRGLAESFMSSNVSKTVEICNKISEKSSRDNCLNNIMGNPEIIQANPDLAVSICGLLTLKANCYSNVAQTLSGVDPKKGALVCQKLSDDVQIFNCYGNTWFSFESTVLQNYDFSISLCNFLTVKRDDCLRRTSEVFMNSDRAKADAICKLMSSSTSSGCLQEMSQG
ncbi:MAG: hypothetical protein NTY99_01770 [DPANN group archaeon]|nr:hypothetical protein [DPANN group archaeon]